MCEHWPGPVALGANYLPSASSSRGALVDIINLQSLLFPHTILELLIPLEWNKEPISSSSPDAVGNAMFGGKKSQNSNDKSSMVSIQGKKTVLSQVKCYVLYLLQLAEGWRYKCPA